MPLTKLAVVPVTVVPVITVKPAPLPVMDAPLIREVKTPETKFAVVPVTVVPVMLVKPASVPVSVVI